MESADLIVASGLSSAEADALASARLSEAEWNKVFLITVDGADVPIAGKYSVSGHRIEFRPAFPFDLGRAYRAALSFDAMPVRRSAGGASATLNMRVVDHVPVTRVTGVHPTAGQWPANLLRAYIHFSGPMGSQSGVNHIVLRDDRGAAVADAFLPLESDFWNSEHTRYTVFFDPGRVKRGILPNRDMGRALIAGRQYTLEVATAWKDAQGRPLSEGFKYAFRAGPAIETPLDVRAWTIAAPPPGTRDPLVVTFPWPIDHGLSMRALSVKNASGARLTGDPNLAAGDVKWSFTPRDGWAAGEYTLVADPILEDPSGNQIGLAFEVEPKTKKADAPHTRTFRVSK